MEVTKKALIILTALFFLFVNSSAQNNTPFVFQPALNSDGSMLAFSYQGDIWVAQADGSGAQRLTIHEAYEGFPKWSSDNSTIAFSSSRYGNNDIFTIPSSGGVSKRITYNSASDNLTDFTSNYMLIFDTGRAFKQVEWNGEVYSVSASGGTEQRFLDAIGDMAVVSPDGRFTAYVSGYRTTREAYRGSANYDIWIYDSNNNSYSKVTEFEGHDWFPQWGDSRTIYFISAESGIYNVHRLKIDDNGNLTGNREQLTNFKEDGLRYLSISRDGSTAAFSRQTDVYVMKTDGGVPQKVDIKIAADYRFDPVEHKSETSGAEEYAVSPNGKLLAFVLRGDVFIKEADKEESRSKNLTNDSGSRYQMVTFLNDSTIIFVSDKYGQRDLFLIRSDDPKQPDLFKSFKYKVVRITETAEEESNPIVSPDMKKIAYVKGRGTFITADISNEGKLSNQVTLLDGWDEPGSVAWSPDSKWLAYQLSDLYFNSEIYIHAADGSKAPVNVTMHPRGDYLPFWSKDGSKLGFRSARNNNNYDIWFAWLKKEDWEKTKEDWKAKKDDNKDDKKDKKKDDKESDVKKEEKLIQIDFENIHRRLTQVTSMTGDEGSFVITNDGETFLFTGDSKTKSGSDLYSVKWDGTELKEVMGGGKSPRAFYLDPEGKYLYLMQSRGSIGRLDIKSSKDENLPYKAEMTVDYYAEQNQIFEEAWRALDLMFYDPDFHGRDFNALKAKYKPWAMAASAKPDFQTVYNEMLGQINASHMGLYNVPDRAETQKDRTGLLGIEIEPLTNGVKVKRVVPNTPADKSTSKLIVGDIIKSVNGSKVDHKSNFYSFFAGKADEQVLLNVTGSDGNEREVIIRPAASIGDELYEEWVEERRQLTEKYSDGRLGYIHIRGMSMPSFEVFERELTASGLGKEGLVIDVRFNGGGWTTDYLMTILNYKQHAYTIPRGSADNLEKEKTKFREFYPLGERLPFAAWTKPSIALCNQNSYSNAEIFSHAYKQLGIGTLVGTPTFGAVISTGGQGLVDGSYVRLPFRGWYVKADDSNMDFQPAVPDIIVDNKPDSKIKNEDPQLKTAVEELLKQIDSN